MPAGEISARLALPPATASFHLAQLATAGLLRSRSVGRNVIYSVDFECMSGLLEYLTEDCCAGRACLPAVSGRRS